MKNWIYVTLISFALIGGTAFFAFWSINQLNEQNEQYNKTLSSLGASLESLSAAYFEIINTSPVDPKDEEQIPATDLNIPEISETLTDLELSFIFPKKSSEIYIGCTYQLSFQSSIPMNSLVTTLIDASAREAVFPAVSGLAKENKIEPDSQNVNWKVGVVWPGKYYIKVSNVNSVDLENRSEVFTISKMAKDTSAEAKAKLCKDSGGSL